jgi:hypothetical protein
MPPDGTFARELIIWDYRIDSIPPSVIDIVVQQLIYQPSKLRFLPIVSTTGHRFWDMNGQLFGDVVATRWIASGGFDVDDSMSEVARLRSVTLELQEGLDSDTATMLRLRRYQDEGLELNIDCY